MPTVTIPHVIDARDAAEKLQQELGDHYTIDSHLAGARNVLRVKHSGLAYANVRLTRDGQATTFRVHGGGFIVGRIANELGIARTVAAALKNAYPPDSAS
jgi:hypothetical protein